VQGVRVPRGGGAATHAVARADPHARLRTRTWKGSLPAGFKSCPRRRVV